MKNETSSSSRSRNPDGYPALASAPARSSLSGWVSLAGVLFAAAGAGGFDWRAGALTLGLLLWIDVRWSA